MSDYEGSIGSCFAIKKLFYRKRVLEHIGVGKYLVFHFRKFAFEYFEIPLCRVGKSSCLCFRYICNKLCIGQVFFKQSYGYRHNAVIAVVVAFDEAFPHRIYGLAHFPDTLGALYIVYALGVSRP